MQMYMHVWLDINIQIVRDVYMAQESFIVCIQYHLAWVDQKHHHILYALLAGTLYKVRNHKNHCSKAADIYNYIYNYSNEGFGDLLYQQASCLKEYACKTHV